MGIGQKYFLLLTFERQLLQRDGTSYKSAKPPNGVPWEPAQPSRQSRPTECLGNPRNALAPAAQRSALGTRATHWLLLTFELFVSLISLSHYQPYRYTLVK